MTKFQLRILTQEWISSDSNETDLCSHGKFELIIGNQVILNEKEDIEWTINTSILKFLRCVESDHIAEQHFDLILHCGELLMLSCPIGIYLDLKHENKMVFTSNVKKQFGVGEYQFESMPKARVELSKNEFAKVVIREAKKVKNFFYSQPKKIADKREELMFNDFWAEFDELLEDAIKKYSC